MSAEGKEAEEGGQAAEARAAGVAGRHLLNICLGNLGIFAVTGAYISCNACASYCTLDIGYLLIIHSVEGESMVRKIGITKRCERGIFNLCSSGTSQE